MSEDGLVTIRRAKGRIAGFAKPPCPVDIIWCGTNRMRKKEGKRQDGWSFPSGVNEKLMQEIQGRTALHLFGGLAKWGARMDVDPNTFPDVLGNAWEAEKYFQRDSFDDVVLDPPYMQYHIQDIRALLIRAAWIARQFVWWFGTVSIRGNRWLKDEHRWLIHTGDQCATRTLQQFRVGKHKFEPRETDLQRGAGLKLKYARWRGLNLDLEFPPVDVGESDSIPRGGQMPARSTNGIYLGDWNA